MLPERRRLLYLFLAALAIRLAWVLSVSRDGMSWNDALFYHQNGYNLGHGKTYGNLEGKPFASWPPGYSAMLAVIYRIFGFREVVGQVFNAFLGALTVPLLYKLVRTPFGPRVALIAASILTVMPGPILWTDMILTETAYSLLLVVFFLLLMRSQPNWKWALILGGYLGLVALTRSEAVVWFLLLPIMWRKQFRWKALAVQVAAAAATMLLVLTPWAVRNTVTMGSFVPLSTNGGGTLYSGHNPNANGMQSYPTKDVTDQYPFGDDWEVEFTSGLQDRAIDYMVHHPVQELILIPKKLLALNRGDSYAFEWINEPPYPTISPVWATYIGVVADLAWFTLLALTLVGVFGLGRAVWRTNLLRMIGAMFILLLVLYGFVYYGNYRYRVPYEPLMMVVAALVIDRGWRGLQAARAADSEAVQTADAETGADAS